MLEYIKRLAPYWKPHRKTLALALVCIVLSGALSGVFLWLFKQVLGEIINSKSPARNSQLNLFMLAVLLWATWS